VFGGSVQLKRRAHEYWSDFGVQRDHPLVVLQLRVSEHEGFTQKLNVSEEHYDVTGSRGSDVQCARNASLTAASAL
jgi:hypothetical protein